MHSHLWLYTVAQQPKFLNFSSQLQYAFSIGGAKNNNIYFFSTTNVNANTMKF